MHTRKLRTDYWLLHPVILLLLLVLIVCCTAGYVWSEEKGEDATVEEQAVEEASLELGDKTYQRYCTICHGQKGDGNGDNAKNLLVKPANHTDAKFMSERTDDKLYDVVNLGGTGIAKSTLMPPWGAALGDVKVQSLVLKLRDLCKCEGETVGW